VANVDAATGLGFRTIQFTDAETLRQELMQLGLLIGPRSSTRTRQTRARTSAPPRSGQ
jgi:hypothetical protein